jgi:hypothetical protein
MPTFVQYTGDGSNATFTVPFPYIERAHVKVRLGGFLCTEGAHYDFTTGTAIRFRPQFVPVLNQPVTLRRETPAAALVTYQDGALLTQEDLNTATRQALYRIEEVQDRYEASLEAGLTRLNNGQVASVSEALDALTQEILASSLAQDLLQRIGDIDSLAQDLLARSEDILQNAANISANTSQIGALQTQINNLATILNDDIATQILNEQTQRISGDEALAQDISLLGAKSGDGTAFILNMNTVRVDSNTALGTRLSGIDTALSNNSALIAQETTARVDAVSALSTSLSALTATVNTNDAAINARVATEETARADGDSALATSISTLSATVTTNNNTLTARIAAEETARADEDSALATSISGLSATVTNNNNTLTARIATEETARADGDSALSSTITALSATVTNNNNTLTARIATEEAARADEDSALSTSISALSATVTSNNNTLTARIATEETARADGDSSLASSITALTSTVNGNTAQIATIQTVQNGIAAQYMVKLDVNGHVSGFGLYNDGSSSQFIINSTKFAIIDPDAGLNSPVVPFAVSGGVVYMQNVVIGNALIDSLAVNKLTTGTLNASMNFGTGVLSMSANGRTMYLGATGIGSSSQYIQWFGTTPESGAAGATDGAAQFYIKNNGDAFFGGTLAANVVTSTNIAANAVSASGSNSSTGTFTNSGYTTRGSVTYTPASADSKLLILVSGTVIIGDAAPANTYAQVLLARDGSTLRGPLIVSRSRGSPVPFAFHAVVSVPDTQARTYDVRYNASASAGGGDPHSVEDSTITILELKK